MDAYQVAAQNLDRHLRQNRYPGRGLAVGKAAGGWVIVYWIMGRSTHSRNRRFVVEGPVLRTEPVDWSQVVDPSLIVYEAMLELPSMYMASNGDQTRTICETLQAGGTFDGSLSTREREPDAPNYTPRISALLDLRTLPGAVSLNILKANLADPALTDRFTYCPAPPPPGLGYGLTTYMSDGNPLPSFTGEPLLLPLSGTVQNILDTYWDALDADNRISLAVKWIAAEGGPGQVVVRNRFSVPGKD